MMEPLVSIIISVFNSENYLNDTLKSVLNQTYNNIEIICVNDGSTDHSLSILKRYNEKIHIINQANKGQCAALNNGLKHSSGEFIKFFDSDDIMNPEHIELQMKQLIGTDDAIASCEWGRFYGMNPLDATFIPETVWRDLDTLTWLKQSLSQRNDMMGAWLWLIPRSIIEKSGGWDERLSLNNDFEFSVRLLLKAKKVKFTEGAKVYYRSGLTNSLANQQCENSFNKAILSTDLGCSYLLNIEYSDQMKLLCANRYQEWVYRMYPKYSKLENEVEQKIKELGGSNIKLDGGLPFRFLRDLIGWKAAKNLQISLNRLRKLHQ